MVQAFCMHSLVVGLGCPLPARRGRFCPRGERSVMQIAHCTEPQRPSGAEAAEVAAEENSGPDVQERAAVDGLEDIYVGNGRFVMDDPKKYPSKDDAGKLFPGISGGWAGGEIGLRAFMEELKDDPVNGTDEIRPKEEGVKVVYEGKEVSARKVGEGTDAIYVGFSSRSEEDTKARKSGAMGNFIVDDAKKYPSREGFGSLDGLTGGFAGGEKGVKQFVEKGDIVFLDPNQRSRQWSPIVAATVVAIVGSVGSILLSDVTDISENLLNTDLSVVSMDEDTKELLKAALELLGLAGAGSLGLALFKTFRERLSAGAKVAARVAVTVSFWGLVAFVAYTIVQS